MSTIIKYIIFIISFTALVLSYLLYTPLGNQQIYSSISYILTKKAGLNVDVESINIKQYPYLETDMLVEDKYNLKLKASSKIIISIWTTHSPVTVFKVLSVP
jgi:hypothetical protein